MLWLATLPLTYRGIGSFEKDSSLDNLELRLQRCANISRNVRGNSCFYETQSF